MNEKACGCTTVDVTARTCKIEVVTSTRMRFGSTPGEPRMNLADDCQRDSLRRHGAEVDTYRTDNSVLQLRRRRSQFLRDLLTPSRGAE